MKWAYRFFVVAFILSTAAAAYFLLPRGPNADKQPAKETQRPAMELDGLLDPGVDYQVRPTHLGDFVIVRGFEPDMDMLVLERGGKEIGRQGWDNVSLGRIISIVNVGRKVFLVAADGVFELVPKGCDKFPEINYFSSVILPHGTRINRVLGCWGGCDRERTYVGLVEEDDVFWGIMAITPGGQTGFRAVQHSGGKILPPAIGLAAMPERPGMWQVSFPDPGGDPTGLPFNPETLQFE